MEFVQGGSANSAGARRQTAKQKASSWSWDDSDDGWGSSQKSGSYQGSSRAASKTGSSRKRYSWQDDENASGPKSRTVSSSRIPSPEQTRRLPQPYAAEDRPPAKGLSEPEFKTGDTVTHHKFGEGTVIESKLNGADEEVVVAFPAVGIKRLVASMAKLEKV